MSLSVCPSVCLSVSVAVSVCLSLVTDVALFLLLLTKRYLLPSSSSSSFFFLFSLSLTYCYVPAAVHSYSLFLLLSDKIERIYGLSRARRCHLELNPLYFSSRLVGGKLKGSAEGLADIQPVAMVVVGDVGSRRLVLLYTNTKTKD